MEGLSYEGGKYPISIDAKNMMEFVPKIIGLRFNAATDSIDR